MCRMSFVRRWPGVIGYAETLLDGALEDKDCNRKFVEIIRTNAIRLNNIASDLLILSELESGVDPPEPESIGVRDVIEGVLLTVKFGGGRSEGGDRRGRGGRICNRVAASSGTGGYST